MQRLTKIGVAVGSVGIAIILGLLAIIESNPFNCPSNEFMCFEPPAARTAKFFLPEGIIIAAIGNALILLRLSRKSSALHKNHLTEFGVIIASVGIAITLGLLAIMETNPFLPTFSVFFPFFQPGWGCPLLGFMCYDPPVRAAAKFFLPEGIIIAAIGNALILSGLWRKSSALHKNHLTEFGVITASVGIAIILGSFTIIESNWGCPHYGFMCFDPPAMRTADAFLPEGIIIAAIGDALIPLGLWRKSSALDKNQV